MNSNLPPDVPGNASPHKLLSSDEMAILQEHYRLAGNCRTTEERERALKGWTDKQRQVVGGLYARLLVNGFTVYGQHEEGTLYFGVRLKSESQLVMELSDADYKLYRAGKIVFDSGRLRRVKD